MHTRDGRQLKVFASACRRDFIQYLAVGCASLLTTDRSSLGLLFNTSGWRDFACFEAARIERQIRHSDKLQTTLATAMTSSLIIKAGTHQVFT